MNHMMMVDEYSRLSPTESGRCPLCKSASISDFLSAPDRFHGRKEMYNLARCTSCYGVWLRYPPKPEDLASHYGTEYYRSVAAAGETSAVARWRKQREIISRFKQGGDILDIGCNSGGFLGSLRGSVWNLHGVEISAEMAQRARSSFGAEIFVGDVLNAPFADASFDVITSFDLLEHIYRPKELARKVMRWLKPSGIFYVMLPNIDSWEARMFGSYWYGLELPRHLFHFSPRSLAGALDSEGFTQEYLETASATYIEYSIRYLTSDLLSNVGLKMNPLAQATKPSIGWRIIRKMLRLAVLRPIGHMASLANAGASIDAVFSKPQSR